MGLPQGVTVVEGGLDASGLSVAIVVARFNAFITERLLEGALDALIRHGALATDQTVVRVPGAYELPMVAAQLAKSGRFDAVVGLGCLMRGDTIHFDLIAGEVTKGLAMTSMQTDVPVSFGVLTTDSLEQAVHRAGAKHGNKGVEAVMAAVEQVRVAEQLRLRFGAAAAGEPPARTAGTSAGTTTGETSTKKAGKKAATKATKRAGKKAAKKAAKRAGKKAGKTAGKKAATAKAGDSGSRRSAR